MLRVFVVCEDCKRQIELLVRGKWDLVDVRHDCAGLKGFDVERAGGRDNGRVEQQEAMDV